MVREVGNSIQSPPIQLLLLSLSLEVDIVPKRYYFVMMMWKEVWVFVLSLFAAGCGGGGKSDVAPLASSSRSTDDGTVPAKKVVPRGCVACVTLAGRRDECLVCVKDFQTASRYFSCVFAER